MFSFATYSHPKTESFKEILVSSAAAGILIYPLESFSVSDNVSGNTYGNIFNILSILLMIVFMMYHKFKHKDSFEITGKTLFMKTKKV